MRLTRLWPPAAAIAVMCASGLIWAVPANATSGPAAELSIDPPPASLSAPLSMTFVARSVRFPAPVVSYFFQFGDGHSVTTTSRKVTHTYASAARFSAKVTETDSLGDMASATGTLEIDNCPSGSTCTQTLTNVGSVQELSVTGNTQPGIPAGVDLFVGPYKIPTCQPTLATDGALNDAGFAGPYLTVTLVYRTHSPGQVNTTCFSSVVPFADAQGNRVHNGALPACVLSNPTPPCVASITSVMTAHGLRVTKVLYIPPNDPKVGSL
jgi:PKD domain